MRNASWEAGAFLGRAGPEALRALKDFARAFGLALQLSDDLIDAEGDAAVVGKRVGKDAGRGKATIVAELGLPAENDKLAAVVAEAEAALLPFGAKAAMLAAAARFLTKRER